MKRQTFAGASEAPEAGRSAVLGGPGATGGASGARQGPDAGRVAALLARLQPEAPCVVLAAVEAWKQSGPPSRAELAEGNGGR